MATFVSQDTELAAVNEATSAYTVYNAGIVYVWVDGGVGSTFTAQKRILGDSIWYNAGIITGTDAPQVIEESILVPAMEFRIAVTSDNTVPVPATFRISF